MLGLALLQLTQAKNRGWKAVVTSKEPPGSLCCQSSSRARGIKYWKSFNSIRPRLDVSM